jgi:hypothetical protein
MKTKTKNNKKPPLRSFIFRGGVFFGIITQKIINISQRILFRNNPNIPPNPKIIGYFLDYNPKNRGKFLD